MKYLIVAVGASPVGPAEPLRLSGSEAVSVKVLQGQVAVHEVNDVARHIVLARLVVSVELEALDLGECGGYDSNGRHLGSGLGSVGDDVVHELSQDML